MTTYLVTFVAFVLVILGMSVGVIFSGKKIQGSCGGLGATALNENGDKTCGYCGATFEEQKEKGCGDEKRKPA
jgi:hypothetical protein